MGLPGNCCIPKNIRNQQSCSLPKILRNCHHHCQQTPLKVRINHISPSLCSASGFLSPFSVTVSQILPDEEICYSLLLMGRYPTVLGKDKHLVMPPEEQQRWFSQDIMKNPPHTQMTRDSLQAENKPHPVAIGPGKAHVAAGGDSTEQTLHLGHGKASGWTHLTGKNSSL